MSRTILTQSIFQTTQTPATGWRSYLTSGVVHALIILILFALVVPTVRRITPRRNESITYLTPPPLPEYRPKIVRSQVVPSPITPVVKPEPKLAPVVKPQEVKHVMEQPSVAPAPELKAAVSAPRILPEPRFEAPAPKREIKTGVLETAEAARGTVEQKAVKTGGFGDPNGLRPMNTDRSGLTMAKVGSFEQPEGSGTAGGGGHAAGGPVRSGGFGSVNSGSSGGIGRGGTVQTGGFGDSTAVAAVQKQRLQPVQPALTPVEILSKPKPAYTDEARNLKLEGQVSLEVVFLSNGSIRVVRVLHGLGHGLDEAAQQAAMQVRFKPATRAGVPVDMNATIKITFQLT